MLIRSIVSPQVPIPNEPGEYMQFRRLNDRRLNECMDKRQTDAMMRMVKLGADAMAVIRSAQEGRKKEEDEKPAVADPLDAYDRALLLKYGIASWSYDAPLSELDEEGGGLDITVSKWAALQILEFNELLPDTAAQVSGN